MQGHLARYASLVWMVWILMPGAGVFPATAPDTLQHPGGGPLKYEEPSHLTGAIYSQGSDSRKLLFNFQREATRTGDRLAVQRDYTDPDGRLAARERAVYEGNDLVFYELKEPLTGTGGSATIHRDLKNPVQGSVEFQGSQDTEGKAKAHTEPLKANTLVNDMIAPFLVSHWDQLMDGQKVSCRYIVVPRKETVGFTFVRDSETTWHDRRVVILKMEPSSLFISALVDPLYFTMEKSPPHRVLQYVGRTTPKIEAGGKWKDLDAVTVFDWDSAR